MAGTRSSANTRPSSIWWTWEVAGLVTIGVGVLVLLEPGKSLKALAVITGIYLLLDSVLAFVAVIARDTANRELAALHGVASLILGLILVRHPLESLTAIAILIGIWLLTVGCLRVVGALREHDHRMLRVLVGLIQAIAGVVVIAQPTISYHVLALVAGLALALQGLTLVALGWTLRGGHEEPTGPALRPGAAPS
jgi:uncharacterized membrane protein HdeD (DUF308 family)